jgi:hypothetical protein
LDFSFERSSHAGTVQLVAEHSQFTTHSRRMTDYFALLNEPRRPWLEPAALKQKFLALSADQHPDRVAQADEVEKRAATRRYIELNAAYNCLREPKERLRHLLELELGGKPNEIERIPAGLMDVFMEVSRTCRQADAFLVEKSKVTSPLLKVQWFERGQEWTETLNVLRGTIVTHRGKLDQELKELDAAWQDVGRDTATRAALLPRLEELYRLFSYFARWEQQIQERSVQLTF